MSKGLDRVAKRALERSTRLLAVTYEEGREVSALVDEALTAIVDNLALGGLPRDWRGEVAVAAHRWADRGRNGR